jgi:hypothetical protein
MSGAWVEAALRAELLSVRFSAATLATRISAWGRVGNFESGDSALSLCQLCYPLRQLPARFRMHSDIEIAHTGRERN